MLTKNGGFIVNRKYLGAIFILVGLCKLSFEIYGLKVLQLLDKASQTSYWSSAWRYFGESLVVVSFLITLCILIAGLVLIIHRE